MQVVVRTTLALGLLGACHVAGHARPDAGDDGSGSSDGGGSAAGLTLTWSVQPTVPGTAQTGISVEELGLQLADADITGDAGSVKSQATKLDWITGTSPRPLSFPSAPIGLYSKIALDFDGQLVDNSWWINGHATVNGQTLPFKIYDRNSLQISLDTSTQLAPGQSATIAILVELDHAFDAIDFSMVDNDAGTLVLSTDSTYMATFAANLASSFVVKTSSQ